jgi:triosephosphate isomerase
MPDRTPFIAGNWKMNLRRASSVALAQAIRKGVESEDLAKGVDIAVCPAPVYVDAVAEALRGSAVGVGVQNAIEKADGAFTGEINPAMALDLGCKYVILGHSERRQFFHETDEGVRVKTAAVLEAGLFPIVCVGETLEQRQSGQTMSVVGTQVRGALSTLSPDQMAGVVIAYEPVWAIGTGVTATPEQAQETHASIRALLKEMFGEGIASATVIQYGGSVKADNAATLLSQPDIDGALVGGASLKVDSFLDIIRAAQ